MTPAFASGIRAPLGPVPRPLPRSLARCSRITITPMWPLLRWRQHQQHLPYQQQQQQQQAQPPPAGPAVVGAAPPTAMSLSRIVTVVRTAAERSRPPPRRLALPFGVGAAAGGRRRSSATPPFALTDDERDAIHAAMGQLRPEDLGFSPSNIIPPQPPRTAGARHRSTRETATQAAHTPISYIHVAENADLLMAIFVLPPGSSIPTHSHPEMFVFSRVLFGELVVHEYDFLPAAIPAAASSSSSSSPLPARGGMHREHIAIERPVAVAHAGDARYLTPSSRNVHSFNATEWTAVFDLIVPPYALPNRMCRYYAVDKAHDSDLLSLKNPKDELVILKEIPCPESYETTSSDYTGVRVKLY